MAVCVWIAISICLSWTKGSRACPWHRCWVGWNESLQRSKQLRRKKLSRLSYNLPFSTRRRSNNWSLLWAHPPTLRMWSMSSALLHLKEKQDLPQPNMTVASVPLPLVASQDAHASLTSRRALMLVHYKDLPTPPPLAVLWSTNGGTLPIQRNVLFAILLQRSSHRKRLSSFFNTRTNSFSSASCQLGWSSTARAYLTPPWPCLAHLDVALLFAIYIYMYFKFGNILLLEFFMFGNMLPPEFFKYGDLWFGKRERENYEGISPAFISLSSGMGSTPTNSDCRNDSRLRPPFGSFWTRFPVDLVHGDRSWPWYCAGDLKVIIVKGHRWASRKHGT